MLDHPPEHDKSILKLTDFMVSTNGCGHLGLLYYVPNSHTSNWMKYQNILWLNVIQMDTQFNLQIISSENQSVNHQQGFIYYQ